VAVTSNSPVSAYIRTSHRSAEWLTEPITTDLFGTELRYYAQVGERVYTSSSVRALARLLGKVTLNEVALAELLSFGLVLRDETVIREIRSIPAHATLNPDGTIVVRSGPRSTSRITDGPTAARRLREILDSIVGGLEPQWNTHCVGFTGGKDSRILAALPKGSPARWHYLAVSGRDDAEHKGSTSTAERLALEHFSWMEWTDSFLEGDVHRVSADLANGVGAVSDFTLLRSYFERYCGAMPGASEADGEVALWIGALADGLFAGTYLSSPANTLWDALKPRTTHLPQILTRGLLDRFEGQRGYYDSNPFSCTVDREDEIGYFIRLFTRGRGYVCRSLACFDRVSGAQVNPYLHPDVVALALETDSRLFVPDSLRDGVLTGLGPGLNDKSAFGYKAPGYGHHVFRALSEEVRRGDVLEGLVAPSLLDEMRAGRFPDLNADPNLPTTSPAAPAYRVHADEPLPGVRSLRDYEHLLVYTTFLNLLAEDGVVGSR
jgi:asparagine synthetase B (glutamine-hydrolysing)